jgi:hypothetical protein
MAASATPQTSAPPAPQGASELVVKALGAGAAGIGGLGLITGVGGAIMFERFSQAGLTAEQAVAVQPKTVLLAVGAEALIPLATTMLLLVAIYLILARRLPIPTGFFAVAAGLGAVLYYLFVVSFSFKLHVLLEVVAATAVACALWALLAGPISSITVRALILAVITALLGCTIALIRTMDAPKVRGAVVVLAKSDKVVAGLYVAETSEQIYLGQVALANSYNDQPKLGSGAIIALNRTEVSAVAFSSNQGLATALRQASLMAKALKEESDGSSLAARLAETVRPAAPSQPRKALARSALTKRTHRHTLKASTHQPAEEVEPDATATPPAEEINPDTTTTPPAEKRSTKPNAATHRRPDEMIEQETTETGPSGPPENPAEPEGG